MRNIIFGGFLVSFGLSLSSLICVYFISLGIADFRYAKAQQILGVQSSDYLLTDIPKDETSQPDKYINSNKEANTATDNLQTISPTAKAEISTIGLIKSNKTMQLIFYIVTLVVISAGLAVLLSYKKKLKTK